MAELEDIKNASGAAVLKVPCPYKHCPAGKGAKCRTKSVYAENEYGVTERVKGGNERDSVHHVRYKKAKAEGVIQ